MKRLVMVTAVAATCSTLVLVAVLGAHPPLAHGAAPAPLWAPRLRGIAATANADASRAAAEILAKGGNAVDAAVAGALALGVVDPESSGLGGGGFAVLWSAKDKRARVLDFRETAPGRAARDMFLVDGKPDAARAKWGGLAVAVPGEPAGLAELEAKHGKLGLAAAAQPAIRLARQGFAIPRHFVEAATPPKPAALPRALGYAGPPELVAGDPLRALLLPAGKPPLERERLRRPELARTLEAYAQRGPSAFYQGAVARALAAATQARGGILTVEDLAGYRPIWREPATGRFRGHALWGTPAPGGGLTAIEALQILDARPPLQASERGSSAADHAIAEALKHAFADRARLLGDPGFVTVPLVRLTSPDYAAALAARVADDKVQRLDGYGDKSLAPPDPAHDHGTSHLCVADGEGNVVALTTTVNLWFGSHVVAGDTGVLLNDEMDDFSAQPGVANAFGLVGAAANAIAPGKRPASSTTPMIVTRDGAPVLCVGGAGGPTIISATVQTIVGVLDYGLDVQAAVNQPRVHAQWMPDKLLAEPDVPRDVLDGLARRGHHVDGVASIAAVQAVALGPERLSAASDPRYGGAPAAP